MAICLYVVGEPVAELASRHGSYVDWFAGVLDKTAHPYEVVDGLAGPHLDPAAFDGILITGSRASMTTPEPWMEAAVETVRQCYERRVPLLGVCFGHQLIGAAFGATVMPNPTGWEIGSCDLAVHESGLADPLFRGVPATFAANQCHRDAVDAEYADPRSGLTILAGNDATAVQALAAGPFVRGVQFHPEVTGAIARSMVENTADAIAADPHTMATAQELESSCRDCPDGEQVLVNWVDEFVRGKPR